MQHTVSYQGHIKMKNRNLFILSVLLIIQISSCRTPRLIYSPSPPNNPYFREKGESKLAAFYSGGDSNKASGEYNLGFDLQSAYAITNNLALTAGYFQRNEKEVFSLFDRRHFDSSVINYKRKLTDFGMGYFKALGKSRVAFFNLYAGAGFGNFSFTDRGIDSLGMNYNRAYSNDMMKWYIQPSLNLFPGENFRLGFIWKYCIVNYSNQQTSYTVHELNYFDLDLLKKKTLDFFDMTLNTQVSFKGAKWLAIEGSVTLSSDPFENSVNLEARNFNASIGVSIDFSKMKKK
jgi:hypothetical protein